MTSPLRFASILPAICVAALTFFTLTGCASQDSVRLLYNPSAPAALPTPTAPTVAVVQFEDMRGREEIGVKRNGAAFRAMSPVADWVSRSLADEIRRTGPQVSYAESLQQAQAGRPDFLVTGRVDEVWIKETGPASCTATVRIFVSMANPRGMVYQQNLMSTQEKTGLPGSGMVEGVLTDALREVLNVAADQIAKAAAR